MTTDAGADPRCSLVLLTHDRRAEICLAVERALALPERPELVVVDNGSRDGSAPILRARWPALQVVRSARNLGAAGRNLGLRETRRRYVAFGDDDTAWQPGALRRAADALDADPRLAIVSARVLIGDEMREDPTCSAMGRSSLEARREEVAIAVIGFLAGACMVRRSAFLALGGYEPRLFLGGEEALLAFDLLAAGWRLGYVPEAAVRHWPSPSRDPERRRRDLRRNAVRVAWLRRPWAGALAVTLRNLAAARRAGDAWTDVLALAGSAPWVLRNRRRLPRRVEDLLRGVETRGRESPDCDARPTERGSAHAEPPRFGHPASARPHRDAPR